MYKKEIIELFNMLFQLAAFIGFSLLITNKISQSIGLGFIICLIWWKLDEIAKNLKA